MNRAIVAERRRLGNAACRRERACRTGRSAPAWPPMIAQRRRREHEGGRHRRLPLRRVDRRRLVDQRAACGGRRIAAARAHNGRGGTADAAAGLRRDEVADEALERSSDLAQKHSHGRRVRRRRRSVDQRRRRSAPHASRWTRSKSAIRQIYHCSPSPGNQLAGRGPPMLAIGPGHRACRACAPPRIRLLRAQRRAARADRVSGQRRSTQRWSPGLEHRCRAGARRGHAEGIAPLTDRRIAAPRPAPTSVRSPPTSCPRLTRTSPVRKR